MLESENQDFIPHRQEFSKRIHERIPFLQRKSISEVIHTPTPVCHTPFFLDKTLPPPPIYTPKQNAQSISKLNKNNTLFLILSIVYIIIIYTFVVNILEIRNSPI